MSSLDEIRKKLQSLEKKSEGKNWDQSSYPFWNLGAGGTSTIRFLPDVNPDNTFFWVEKQVIKIPFAGVKGNNDLTNVIVQVPCNEMWERNGCPILNEIRPWFNDPTLEKLARSYWKKRSYIFQGFVIEDGLKEKELPENPIRKFIVSGQIFKIVKAALLNPEMENTPVDFDNGTNFKISCTKNGTFLDYTTSTWARKETALTEDQRDAIEKHGLFDLATFLPKRPDADSLVVIKEMFDASVNGELYDPARWGDYYKPWGLDDKTASTSTTTIEAHEDEPAETPAPVAKAEKVDNLIKNTGTDNKKSAQDILEMLRNRNKQTS
jgi:hypothetical protein